MNDYMIGLVYSDKGCDIYFGLKTKVMNVITAASLAGSRPYAKSYPTEDKMLLQLEYYRSEKPESSIFQA
ncbi:MULTISPECIES: hypothetical protein [unclassified Paenibacillus]|uniref:hypothetical protein n=1 Tax=unclassified Paenibacillus TaxID=185978 RepID=UPI00034E58E4|nr:MULTISPECIES: hypothetical protein [unclassified Paenibacillus]EPD81315.1 hypothetical protein HMPREF1207_05072 [Paenibacillus sp. HGH0039]